MKRQEPEFCDKKCIRYGHQWKGDQFNCSNKEVCEEAYKREKSLKISHKN